MYTDILERQRQFFALLEEFFCLATGDSFADFKARGPFDRTIRARASTIAKHSETAFPWFEERVRPLYSSTWRDTFSDARALGGMKLVFGGTSRLSASRLDAVRKMLLYADTILIPDPILPWLETERREEKFRHVLLLEQVFTLLHLQPLADASLPYPAIMVFPSWEKRLEERDPTTLERQLALTTSVVAHHIGHAFADFNELRRYAVDESDSFMTEIDSARLFLAPGALTPGALGDGLARYVDHISTWRTSEHVAALRSLPMPLLLLNALHERIAPHYHLLENAEELAAHPMMTGAAEWHYHKLIAVASEERLLSRALLSPATVAILRSLNQPATEWLGNIEIGALVELRRNNENERFRNALKEHTSQLHEATLEDLDYVAAQVGRGLTSLVTEHKREVRRLSEQYRLSYSKTLAGGVVTAAALFVPALAPFVGGLLAPTAVAGAYLATKQQELLDRSRAQRSLTGVLAMADERSS